MDGQTRFDALAQNGRARFHRIDGERAELGVPETRQKIASAETGSKKLRRFQGHFFNRPGTKVLVHGRKILD
jgi:hypothetical protein